VRWLRDGNYIYTLGGGTGRTWLASLDGTAGTAGSSNCITGTCVVDPVQNTIAVSSSAKLYRNAAGLYTQVSSGGTITPFLRTVRLTAVPGSTTEMVLTVTVTWTTKNISYTHTVTENLHNWL
jgi:hypothetical protein